MHPFRSGDSVMALMTTGHRCHFLATLLAACLLSFVSPTPAQSQTSDLVELELGADYFVAGNRVDVTKPVAGDLVAAGGEVAVSADVSGDLIVTGGKVRLDSTVQQDALVTGGEVTIAGTINRSVRAGGGKVTLERGARINGNATFGAGELNVAGEVTGYLLAGGGRIYINAPIGGDVRLGGGDIELGPDARINGNLLYRSRNELKRAPGAQILGSVKRLPSNEPARAPTPVRGVGLLLWWCLGLGVVATILLATVPGFTKRVSSTARERPGWSLLFGFIALVATPIAAVIALVTVIGIPVGVLTFLAYPMLLLVGYVLAAVALGDMALTRIQPDRADERSRRIIASLAALLILGLLARVPVLGGWLGLFVLLLGVGALLQQFRRTSASVAA